MTYLGVDATVGRADGDDAARQQFVKDPDTGRRQARPNPENKWVVEPVPQLRIVPDDLWRSVKERQQQTRSQIITKDKGVRSERARRPNYLLSGLLKCGSCGGGFSKISQSHYGCSTARRTLRLRGWA